MAIVVFVTKLFCRVDDPMKDIPNHDSLVKTRFEEVPAI